MSELIERKHIQEQMKRRDEVASKVYDLLKEEKVSIADAVQILDVAQGYVRGAERKTLLP